MERKGLVTMLGNPVTLVGAGIKAGDKAPGFKLLNTAMKEVSLADFKGKVVVLASVPSLDTPVCELETKRFNHEAGALGPDVQVLTISMDLPFAQKRWCGAMGVDKLITLSDHRQAEFGKKYGVLMKEPRLLARAIFVIDQKGVARHVELVPEIAKEPNYEAALKAVKALL